MPPAAAAKPSEPSGAATGESELPPGPPLPPELAKLAECERQSPPELSVLQMPADAKWRSIVPLITSEAEVRTLLGEPKEVYPDDGTTPTLLIYDAAGPWDAYIYLVEGDYAMRQEYPPAAFRRVGSIDLLPEGDGLEFKQVRVPDTFTRKEVGAADAVWVDFRHPTGLTYAVYGRLTSLGQLQRVSHRPSDCQRKALGLPVR